MTSEPSRRELNKAATRDAIAAAALDLLRSRGLGEFTADDISDAAGISRRTFFNYFTSPEAALTVSTEEFLERALQEFNRRPLDEAPLDSAVRALTAITDPMLLSPVAEVFGLAGASPQVARYQLEAWDKCAERIIEAVHHRYSEALNTPLNPLFVSSLVGSVLACGRAAMTEWLHRRGPDTSPDSMAILRALLIDAVAFLRDGFGSFPSPVSTPDGSASPAGRPASSTDPASPTDPTQKA